MEPPRRRSFKWDRPAGPFVAADPASSFNADGTITIIVPKSAIGNPASGAVIISGFLVRITANLVGVTLTPDNMPDSLAPSGSYSLVGSNILRPECRADCCPDSDALIMGQRVRWR